jgi:hypothetical protein
MISSAAVLAEQAATARHGGSPLALGVLVAVLFLTYAIETGTVPFAGLFTRVDLGRPHPARS